MLAILWSSFRDIFHRLHCKICKHKSFTSVGMIIHLWRKHRIKITKKDMKFLIIYSLLIRGIIGLLSFVLFIPLFLLKIVCALFKIIYEIL